MKTKIIQNIKSIILALILVLGVSYVSATGTWVAPTATAPGDNTDTPLNVGNVGQIKTGGLTLGSNCVSPCVNGLIVQKGNVGIGIATPAAKLHISAGNLMVSRESGDLNSVTLNLYQNNVASNNGNWIIASRNTPNLGFYNVGLGDDVMTILPTGNVGIGIKTPGAKLEVAGQVKITGGTPGAGKVLTSDAVGLATWQVAAGGGVGGSGTANYIPKWSAATTLANSTIYDNGTNVGIGTAVPAYKLDVHGDIATDARIASQGNALLALQSTANVGIGTAVPGAKLDIVGSQRISGDIDISGSNRWILHSPDDGRTSLYLAPRGASDWNWAAGTEFVNNGNVNFSGQLKIAGGSPGAGKVLTSDANGLASWQAAAGGGGLGGSGTANYIPKWTAATTLGNSQFYDDGTNAGAAVNGGFYILGPSMSTTNPKDVFANDYWINSIGKWTSQLAQAPAPIPTGLYGNCSTSYGETTYACVGATAPAACSGNTCICQAGYTKVTMGGTCDYGCAASLTYYTCRKN